MGLSCIGDWSMPDLDRILSKEETDKLYVLPFLNYVPNKSIKVNMSPYPYTGRDVVNFVLESIKTYFRK
jgi:hypothetical protein